MEIMFNLYQEIREVTITRSCYVTHILLYHKNIKKNFDNRVSVEFNPFFTPDLTLVAERSFIFMKVLYSI